MKDAPDLKVGATLLRYGRGASAEYEARLGVLHSRAATAARAKTQLAEDVRDLLGDPERLLEVALEAAARNDVDVAAVAARRGYALSPVRVAAGEAPRELVVPERRVLSFGDLRGGMLVACSWKGGRAWPTPHLGLVQERATSGMRPMHGLFLEWVDHADPSPATGYSRGLGHSDDLERDPAAPGFAAPPWSWPEWWRPGDWSGEWLWAERDLARLGEVELVAEGLPRGVSAAEVRRLAELAGWPGRFLTEEAALRRLVCAELGVGFGGDAPRRAALVAEAASRATQAEADLRSLQQIVGLHPPDRPLALDERHERLQTLAAWLWGAVGVARKLGREAGPHDLGAAVAVAPGTTTVLRRLALDCQPHAVEAAATAAGLDGEARQVAVREALALLGKETP